MKKKISEMRNLGEAVEKDLNAVGIFYASEVIKLGPKKTLPSGLVEQYSEFLGVSNVEEKANGKIIHTYLAAITLPSFNSLPEEGKVQLKKKIPQGLKIESISSGRYAKFLLRGSYTYVWPAFDRAFRYLNEHRSKYELTGGVCLENYISDPTKTPEDQLLTEILIPIK